MWGFFRGLWNILELDSGDDSKTLWCTKNLILHFKNKLYGILIISQFFKVSCKYKKELSVHIITYVLSKRYDREAMKLTWKSLLDIGVYFHNNKYEKYCIFCHKLHTNIKKIERKN